MLARNSLGDLEEGGGGAAGNTCDEAEDGVSFSGMPEIEGCDKDFDLLEGEGGDDQLPRVGKGSPVGSSSSSEHGWPLTVGAHAGETKRTCAVCLVGQG